MNLEIKILIFWIAIVAILYLVCKVRFILTERTLNWKYFKGDYCTFGALYFVVSRIGCVAWAIYLLVRLAVWWFNIEIS